MADKLSGLFDLLCRHWCPPPVDAARLGPGDAVGLTLSDDGPLELSDSAEHAQEEPTGRRRVVGVCLALLEEPDPDPGGGEFTDESVKVP